MAHMNLFTSPAFQMAELTDTVNKVPYLPTRIRSMNLFAERRVRTPYMTVEEKSGTLNIIQTSARGEPIDRNKHVGKRILRQFQTSRIVDSASITADEVQSIRAFGSESELMQVQAEMADRINGPTGAIRNFELTWEHQQLGAIQGIVLDADGSILYNWFDEFGISQAAEIDFDLDNASPASGAVRKKCNQVIRQMMRAAQGAWVDGQTSIRAICGDDFWDLLTQHEEVRSTYLATVQAADLRGNAMPFEQFSYGGITWENYRGTDDNSTVAIGTSVAKFFPVNAPGAFVSGYSPGEFFGRVNRPGQPLIARTIIVPDAGGNMDEA